MKLGNEVRLTIRDHCHKSGDMDPGPMTFCVYGRVVAMNAEAVGLASWVEPDGSIDQNTEVYYLLRSAIQKVKVFK